MTVPEHEIHYLDIVTPDAEAARDLYGQAYGWKFEGMAPEMGNPCETTTMKTINEYTGVPCERE